MPLSRASRILLAVTVAALFGAGSVSQAQSQQAEAELQAATQRAKTLRQQGKVDEAIAEYRRAVALAARAYGGQGDLRVVPLLDDLAALYQARANYDQAEFLYRRGLEIREDNLGADHVDVAWSLNQLGVLYAELAQHSKAEPLYRRVLRIWETKRGKDHPDVAAVLNNLANLYRETAAYGKAEPLYQRSLQIREAKLGRDHLAVAGSVNDLAILYWAQGQYAKAEPLYQRSLQIYEAKLGKEHPDVATNLNNLAILYKDLSQYAKAEPLFQRSLRIDEAKLGKDHPNVAADLNNLASLYHVQGQYAKAEPLYQRSLQIDEAKLGKDHPNLAMDLNNLADVYRLQGQYAKAEPLYQRSLQIRETKLGKDHPDVADSLSDLARLYEGQGQYARAEPLYQRSLQIREAKLGKDHPDIAQSLNNLASFYEATQRWQQAAEATDAARRGLRRHVSRVLPALAETEQRTFLHEKVEGSWHQALSLALARPDEEDLAIRSAAWLVNGKALSQQALAERTLLARDSADPATADIARELRTVRASLANLTYRSVPPGQEERAREERAALSVREERLSQRLGQASGRPARTDPWVEVAEVRKGLPADGVLIDIARIWTWDFLKAQWQSARYAAWVIPSAGKGKVQLLDLGPADRIEAAVRAVRKALNDSPRRILTGGERDSDRELRPPLEALSRLVLHPLLPHAGEAKRWLLSPDADLWLVPWAALPLEDGRYTIEQYQIRYAVSGRDLVANAGGTPATGRPVVLADPDYDLQPSRPAANRELGSRATSGTLPRVQRLANTAAEARAIAPNLARYAGAEPLVHLREQALEHAFKALSRPRVVVLSTHGFFMEDQTAARPEGRGAARRRAGNLSENPLLRCGLLLAGCNQRAASADGDDGVLTGLEIVGTDLRGTELVVLSACETGLGDVHNGEGVAGLRQAFQLAGARSVLATLWSVEDRETAQLMTDFFEQVADGKGKAAALRHAQLERIKVRRDQRGVAHPFFWAAFTLTGQGP